jgi:hypothetical protein
MRAFPRSQRARRSHFLPLQDRKARKGVMDFAFFAAFAPYSEMRFTVIY